jgi:hypothetical protein
LLMNTFLKMVYGCLGIVILSCQVSGALLNPHGYPSAGDFVSLPGTYSINSDSLVMSGPNGFHVSGILENGIAIFAFDNFSLLPGASLITTGNRPAAILSVSDVLIAGGGITALGGGGKGGEPRVRGVGPGGGFPGFNFFGGAGGGGGFGGMGGRGQFVNATFDFPGDGGPAYGDLTLALEGGSGGGGGKTNAGFESAGGDGGGALEIGAFRSITIASLISADGLPGPPRGSNHTGGGGGSGGGLILHARSIVNLGTITARGGRGGDGVFENGGGGGGGRILIDTMPDWFSNAGQINVGGGAGPSDFFGAGQPGQMGVLQVRSTIVPEPGSVTLTMTVLLVFCRRVVPATMRTPPPASQR